jgi:hypothetical protein
VFQRESLWSFRYIGYRYVYLSRQLKQSFPYLDLRESWLGRRGKGSSGGYNSSEAESSLHDEFNKQRIMVSLASSQTTQHGKANRETRNVRDLHILKPPKRRSILETRTCCEFVCQQTMRTYNRCDVDSILKCAYIWPDEEKFQHDQNDEYLYPE